MEKLSFVNKDNKKVYYLKWEVESPKAVVVIAHGMVEHPARYDHFAKYLNDNNIAVYGIYHIGHGENAEVLNHMGENEFDLCISNMKELVDKAKNECKCKVFLLGHSMGSFMSQLYVTRYHNLDGLILSGSTKANFLAKAGSVVASIMCAFSKDKTKPSKFLDNMAFGSYNKVFKNARTKFDWLSRDEKQVDKYIADPYCGGVCSVYFFKNLTSAMAKMGKERYIKNISLNTPIYVHGGSMDPVSDMGKGLKKLYYQYVDLGVKDVKLDIYDGARHEIYNEINKDEVYKNTLDFINSHI